MLGGNEDEGARLFSRVPTESTRGNGHKLEDREEVKQRERKAPFILVDVRCWSPGVTGVQPGTGNQYLQ